MGLRRILRIARWEIAQITPTVSRRTAAMAAVALLLVTLVAGAGLAARDQPSSGLYAVGVEEGSPYYNVTADGQEFRTVEPDVDALRGGSQDLIVREDGTVLAADTEKGRAALTEYRSMIRGHNDRMMNQEENNSAAFPLSLTVRYVPAGASSDDIGELANGSDAGGSGGPGAVDRPDPSEMGPVERVQYEARQAFGFEGATTANTPGGIQPPFPFQSLLLSLFFLVPLNFVAQAYGSNVMRERLNHRGELLLTSPASRWEIIAGKALPYAVSIAAVSAAVAAVFGAGVLAVAAIVPLGLVLMSGVFVAAMFARSFKDLTFVTTFLSVSVISYAFVPAMFVTVHPIAAISPLTVVVKSLQPAATPTMAEFLFSFTPLTVLTACLYVLGGGLYREEDMFAERPIRAKVLDSLAALGTRIRRIPLVVFLLMPVVFVTELLLVAGLFPVPQPANIVVLFIGIAVIEELAKSLPVRAGLSKGQFGLTSGVVLGAIAGASFFVAEKLTVFVQLVGMQQLDIGQAAFAGTGTGAATGIAAAGAFFAPLALHGVTAAISGYGASGTTRKYVACLLVAVTVHTLYNLTVVMTLG